jgi:hypothetical protein
MESTEDLKGKRAVFLTMGNIVPHPALKLNRKRHGFGAKERVPARWRSTQVFSLVFSAIRLEFCQGAA